jgi:hypothetical protein
MDESLLGLPTRPVSRAARFLLSIRETAGKDMLAKLRIHTLLYCLAWK